MDKLNVLIVEDEAIIAVSIKSCLQSEGYDVVGMVSNVEAALQILENNRVDLAILDINIQGDRNGIWLGNYLFKNFGIPFLYLTAYSNPETLSEAKISEPAAYLVKPFSKSNLFASIQVALYKHLTEEERVLERLCNGIENETFKVDKEFVFVKTDGNYKKIYYKDLYYLNAEKNYVAIHLESESFVVRSTFRDITENLPEQFIKTHRSFIVNSHKIDHIGKNEIQLGKYTIPLVKAYKEPLLSRINKF